MKRGNSRGFTLMELLVAIAVGMVIVGAGVLLYKDMNNTAVYMNKRSTVTSNARTGLNMMTQDLNLAGYGLPIAGVVVPSEASFGCKGGGSSPCPPNGNAASGSSGAYAFPVVGTSAAMYGIMPLPGPSGLGGMTINGVATDAVAVAYVDAQPNFATDACSSTSTTLTNQCGFDAHPICSATVNNSGGVTLTFDPNTTPAITDTQFGFQAGDLVMVSNVNGQAIGEVTATPSSNTLTLGFGDRLKFQQVPGTAGAVSTLLVNGGSTGGFNYNPPAGSNSGCSASAGGTLPSTTVGRVYVVTYYVQANVLDSSLPPRLYRQVNGNTNPVPAAEQVGNLTITYNFFNSVCGTQQAANQEAPTNAQVPLIKSLNVTLVGASTKLGVADPIQQVPLSTTVSPRNLSYFDSYSSRASSSGC